MAISQLTPALPVLSNMSIQGLDPSSLALIKHLNLAMKGMGGEESVVDNFTTKLFWALGYEMEQP